MKLRFFLSKNRALDLKQNMTVQATLPISSAGLRCALQCSEGTWGLQCNQTCSCLNSATCQAHTGTCLCKPGFWGAQCQHSEYILYIPVHSSIPVSLRAPVTLELVQTVLSSLQCVVLVSLERGAAVTVHHVYMPPPAIT